MQQTTTSAAPQPGKGKHVTLLIIRMLLGLAFIASGAAKAAAMPGTIDMFTSYGLPIFMAYLISYCEIGGGILLLAGLWTKLVSFLLSIIMVGAVYYSWITMGPAIALLPGILFVLLFILMNYGGSKFRIKSSGFN